jgi:citrate lyase subunit beta/citryl-CoA lyase
VSAARDSQRGEVGEGRERREDLLEQWPRTWLFTPADDPRKLRSSLASAADAVIADLEDAVAPARKDEARERAFDFLHGAGGDGAGGQTRAVRINDLRTERGREDLDRLGARRAIAVMVPKSTLATAELASSKGAAVIALIETPQGVVEAESIALLPGVFALAIGTVDLASELGLGELPDGLELLYARSRLVLAAALAGIPAIDGVHVDLHDERSLRAEAQRARALGFAGKLCIHPAQIAPVREAFTPAAAELARARRIVEAYQQTLAGDRGVALSDGEMVDAASVRRALRILRGAPDAHPD